MGQTTCDARRTGEHGSYSDHRGRGTQGTDFTAYRASCSTDYYVNQTTGMGNMKCFRTFTMDFPVNKVVLLMWKAKAFSKGVSFWKRRQRGAEWGHPKK